MPTKEECIRAAAVVAAEGYSVLYDWPLDAAAERSRRPGESFESARARIAARRELRRRQAEALASSGAVPASPSEGVA